MSARVQRLNHGYLNNCNEDLNNTWHLVAHMGHATINVQSYKKMVIGTCSRTQTTTIRTIFAVGEFKEKESV